MFFLVTPAKHALEALHISEHASMVRSDLPAFGYAASTLIARALHSHESSKQPPRNMLEEFHEQMTALGQESVFFAAIGPTGLLGPDIERATRPDMSVSTEAKPE